MSFLQPIIHQSVEADVSATATTQFAGDLESGTLYRLISSTASWVRQGQGILITCATKANMLDNETLTITSDEGAVIYDFDVDGVDDGDADNTRVNISGATTAASVAVILAAAIAAAQTDLVVTDNLDGTIRVEKPGGTLTGSDTVAHASFTIAANSLKAAKASGSMFVGANEAIIVDPKFGPDVAILRDAADGKATLTPLRFVR